jgi:hypothetical protein
MGLFVAENSKTLNTPTEGLTFKIVNGVLVQADGDGGEVRKERFGAQDRYTGSLIGAWRYRHYTGAVAFELYTAGRAVALPSAHDVSGGLLRCC